jgi:hypothetical protein
MFNITNSCLTSAFSSHALTDDILLLLIQPLLFLLFLMQCALSLLLLLQIEVVYCPYLCGVFSLQVRI